MNKRAKKDRRRGQKDKVEGRRDKNKAGGEEGQNQGIKTEDGKKAQGDGEPVAQRHHLVSCSLALLLFCFEVAES